MLPLLASCGIGLCISSARCGQGGLTFSLVSDELDFGLRSFSTNNDVTITLTNASAYLISDLAATSPSDPFSFSGGAYPGMGGTCGMSILSGQSCTLVLRFASPPPPQRLYESSFSLTFYDGFERVTRTFALKGTSDNGSFNLAKGLNDDASAIRVGVDGIYVGGSFTAYTDGTAFGVARFNSSGGRDTAFDSGTGPTGISGATIYALETAVDGSQKIYAGGYFSAYQGTATGGFVRLNTDGSMDSTFSTGTGFNSFVLAIAPALDGSTDVYVGGDFATYNGTASSRIIRLNTNGSVDTAFNIGAGFTGGVVNTLRAATDASGDVYAGGSFTTYRGGSANNIVRINSNGTADGAFAIGTGFNGEVHAIAIANDGTGDVYVGGTWTQYQGVAAPRVVRLNSNGTRDGGFAPTTGFVGGYPLAIEPASDGSGDIYIGGNFTTYNGTAAEHIVRINSDGSYDSDFNTTNGFNDRVVGLAIAPDGSGDVFAVGWMTQFADEPASYAVRIKPDGSSTTFFDGGTVLDGEGRALFGSSTGSIYVGGLFNAVNGVSNPYFAKLTTKGAIDSSFQLPDYLDYLVDAIAEDPQGRMILGGGFDFGGAQTYILRTDPNGTFDPAFTGGAGHFDYYVRSIALASDGDIYVGGEFDYYDAVQTEGVARLNSDGTLDTGFNVGVGFNNTVFRILLDSSTGYLYVGGFFTSYKGTGINRIARLKPDGSLDTAFATGTGFDNVVSDVQPAATPGKIYVAGDFTSFNGTSVNRLARLNSDGTLDTSFNIGSGFDGTVTVVALDASGDGLFVGGWFTSVNGDSSKGLARLNSDGSRDPTFDVGTGFDNQVRAILWAPDGTQDLYVTGRFKAYKGTSATGLVRLSRTGAMD